MPLSIRPVLFSQESCQLPARLDGREQMKRTQKTTGGCCAKEGPSQSKNPPSVMDPCHTKQLIYRRHMPWVEGETCDGNETGFWFYYIPSRSSLRRKCRWCSHPKSPQVSADVHSSPAVLADSALQPGKHQPALIGIPQVTQRGLGTEATGSP